MPRSTEPRRLLNRRSLPPRPAFAEPVVASVEGSSAPRGLSRPARLVEREAPYLMNELKRVAVVTSTCVALLVMLAIVDRMR